MYPATVTEDEKISAAQEGFLHLEEWRNKTLSEVPPCTEEMMYTDDAGNNYYEDEPMTCYDPNIEFLNVLNCQCMPLFESVVCEFKM